MGSQKSSTAKISFQRPQSKAELQEQRRWLKVPYSDKDKAKKVGAQWDALVKMWWVPMHVPIRYVQKWVLTGEKTI